MSNQLSDDEVHDLLNSPVSSPEELIMRERLRMAHIELRARLDGRGDVSVAYFASNFHDRPIQFNWSATLFIRQPDRVNESFSAPTLDGAVNLALCWLTKNQPMYS